jgi:hypothetical protein
MSKKPFSARLINSFKSGNFSLSPGGKIEDFTCSLIKEELANLYAQKELQSKMIGMLVNSCLKSELTVFVLSLQKVESLLKADPNIKTSIVNRGRDIKPFLAKITGDNKLLEVLYPYIEASLGVSPRAALYRIQDEGIRELFTLDVLQEEAKSIAAYEKSNQLGEYAKCKGIQSEANSIELPCSEEPNVLTANQNKPVPKWEDPSQYSASLSPPLKETKPSDEISGYEKIAKKYGLGN